jgi:hypothetical protein
MARQKMSGTRKKPAVSGKRKTTRRHSKRRRMGAIGAGGIIQKIGGLGVGAVGSREIVTLVAKMFPGVSPTIAGLLQFALGYFTPQFVKSQFGSDMGDGAMAAAIQNLLVTFGVISGIGEMNDRMSYQVNGANFNTVAGYSPNRLIGSGNFNTVAGGINGMRPRRQQSVIQRQQSLVG